MTNIEHEITSSTEVPIPSADLPAVDEGAMLSHEMALALGKITPHEYERTLPPEYRLPIPKNQI